LPPFRQILETRATKIAVINHTHENIVVVAEDDTDDYLLIEDAWTEVSPSIHLVRAENGRHLLELLAGMAPERRVCPAIVLLDLNMPLVDGWGALAALKEHDDLKSIPVVILTTSSVPDHVCRAYNMQAAGFITKPASYRELVDKISCLHSYWFLATSRQDRASCA